MGRDRAQRTCLPGYSCLMGLVCDLQSMFHKPLPHLTVITNKHHAQSLWLLFVLSVMRPKVWWRERCVCLFGPPFSQRICPAGRGQRQSWGGTPLPGIPTPHAQVSRGRHPAARKGLSWDDVGKTLGHGFTVSLRQAKKALEAATT